MNHEMVRDLAAFVVRRSWNDLDDDIRRALKLRILDSLGCAFGALGGEPIRPLREHVTEFGGDGPCTLLGGGRAAPDRAAFYNGALVRYLDFNDSYLAAGETCHPSDNLGAVLAAAEYADATGQDLLTALAVAYQVQCRLSDEAPVRHKGFDHTTQGAYAAAAGAARALGLDEERTAHGLAISGTALNALRVTRTGRLSHWKGLAYPHTAGGATQAVFLARRGITGPLGVFEGNKGFMDTIAGPFRLDWAREDLSRVTRTIIKRFNAEIHSQSATEALLDLKSRQAFAAADVRRIEVDIFDVAYHIIGGGEEGGKLDVHTKEEADHSLPYILAVALLDGRVMPEQYRPERIGQDDVHELMAMIEIRPNDEYSMRFPHEMPCRVTVHLADGRRVALEKDDYRGFHTQPLPWADAASKFRQVSRPHLTEARAGEIIAAVDDLPAIRIRELTRLLGGQSSVGTGS